MTGVLTDTQRRKLTLILDPYRTDVFETALADIKRPIPPSAISAAVTLIVDKSVADIVAALDELGVRAKKA